MTQNQTDSKKSVDELNQLLSQYFDELMPERKPERSKAIESGIKTFNKLKTIKFTKLPKFKKI